MTCWGRGRPFRGFRRSRTRRRRCGIAATGFGVVGRLAGQALEGGAVALHDAALAGRLQFAQVVAQVGHDFGDEFVGGGAQGGDGALRFVVGAVGHGHVGGLHFGVGEHGGHFGGARVGHGGVAGGHGLGVARDDAAGEAEQVVEGGDGGDGAVERQAVVAQHFGGLLEAVGAAFGHFPVVAHVGVEPGAGPFALAHFFAAAGECGVEPAEDRVEIGQEVAGGRARVGRDVGARRRLGGGVGGGGGEGARQEGGAVGIGAGGEVIGHDRGLQGEMVNGGFGMMAGSGIMVSRGWVGRLRSSNSHRWAGWRG